MSNTSTEGVIPASPLLARALAAALLLALAAPACAGFTEVRLTTMTNVARDVELADFDGDGDLDVLVINSNQASRLYRNDMTPTTTSFYHLWTSTTALDDRVPALADFDNDGDVDFVLCTLDAAAGLRFFQNDGTGRFTRGWGSAEVNAQRRCAAADFDNDGFVDFAVVKADLSVAVYRNKGDRTFSIAWSNAGDDLVAIAVGDMDSDGDVDLILGGNAAGTVPSWQIHRNNGGFSFTAKAAFAPENVVSQVAVGDLNNDGKLDIVSAAGSTVGNSPGPKTAWRNDGSLAFTKTWVSAESDNNTRVPLGDFNSDGRLDILSVNGDLAGGGVDRVYVSTDSTMTGYDGTNGGGGYVTVSSSDSRAGAWGDLNGDGRLDFISANTLASPGAIAHVFINDGAVNSAPSPPSSGFSNVYSSGTMTLKWGAGSDEDAPAAGLYYMVRAGTSPLSSPTSANRVSGVYGSPLMGLPLRPTLNSSQLGVNLTGQAAGLVYWQVAAIDPGLKRGTWSAEQVASVPPAAGSVVPAAKGAADTSTDTGVINMDALGGGTCPAAVTANDQYWTLSANNNMQLISFDTTTLTAAGISVLAEANLELVYCRQSTYDGLSTQILVSTVPSVNCITTPADSRCHATGARPHQDVAGSWFSRSFNLMSVGVDTPAKLTALALYYDGIDGGSAGLFSFDRVRITVRDGADTTAPGSVTNLVAAPGSSNGEVTLTWTAPGNDGYSGTASKYVIKTATFCFNGTDFNQNGALVSATHYASVPSPSAAGAAQTLTLPGLTPGQQYWFALKSTDAYNNISLIDEKTAGGCGMQATASATSGPPAPGGLQVQAVHVTSITASWLLTASATGYTLAVSTKSVNPPEPIWASSTTVGNAVTTATVFTPALEPNTTHFLFVRANQNGESSAYSSPRATATLAALPLTAASTFSAVAGDGFQVAWERNGNPLAITSYTLVLSTAADFNIWATSVTLTTAPAAGPAATFTGLEGLTIYYAQVRAVNHNNIPTDYAFLGSTTTLIKTPAGLQFQRVNTSSVAASWVLTNGATGYTLAASLNASAPPNPVFGSSTTVGNAVTTAAVVSPALVANTTYYFFARSNGLNNSSAYSASIGTATLAMDPAAAAQAFLGVYVTSASVAWSRNGNPASITTYTVVLSPETPYPNANPSNVTLTTAPAGSSPSATITGLNGFTTYYLFVRAVNHNEVPTAYVALGSTRTTANPKTWLGTGGNKFWHTAANWNPSGVPAATDAVTIDLSESVSVSPSGPAISFAALTLGKADRSVNSNLTIATVTAQAGSVTIYGNSGFTQRTTHTLVLSGVTMYSGSSMTHVAQSVQISSVAIRVSGTFDLQAGATITAYGLGYAGGAVDTAGSGPGGGGTDTANSESGGGAGHGGAGGAGVGAPGGAGGATYGSLSAPIAHGSGGGGGGSVGTGGAGGGAVYIDAVTMKLAGVIVSSGVYASTVTAGTAGAGGGGSGGSVYIVAGTLSGTGQINAKGGAGGDSTGNTADGGGGAGGRVAVSVTVSGRACDLQISVTGGAPGTGGTAAAGGAGTVNTATLLPTPTFSAVYSTTGTIHWTWSESAGATAYRLYDSGGAPVSAPLAASVTFYTEPGLLPNTTYTRYVEAQACGSGFPSAQRAFATLASTVTALAQAFPAVNETLLSAAWAALPPSPLAATSEGYLLELSSRADFADPDVVRSSVTYNAAASTLTFTGLLANTTYHARVASLTHDGRSGVWIALGSTSTLAAAPALPSESFTMVGYSSATVSWLAGQPRGYLVQASTTNFGAITPGGIVFSSRTDNGLSTSLTVAVPALELCTPHYFRVGSLNWSGAANFTAVGSTSAALDYGVVVSTRDLVIGGVDVDTEVIISTSFAVLSNPGCPVTYSIRASTLTAGSPWVISTSSATDTFTLQALFNGVLPVAADYEDADKLIDGWQTSTSGVFAGGQTGMSVPHEAQRLLWLRIGMPRITSTADPQQIRVLIRADPP